MTDRISYSYSLKVPGAEQYSSVCVSSSLETDVRAGETLEQAAERARNFVQDQCERDLPMAAVNRPQSRVDDEKFDVANPVHFRIAQSVFDTEGVKSEAQRTFMLHNLLRGQRVGDTGRLVRQDIEAWRSKKSASSGGEPFRVARQDGSKGNWNGRWPRRG